MFFMNLAPPRSFNRGPETKFFGEVDRIIIEDAVEDPALDELKTQNFPPLTEQAKQELIRVVNLTDCG